VFLASSIRLFLVPDVAFVVVSPFSHGEIENAASILQAANADSHYGCNYFARNNIVPSLMASVVIVSTLAHLATLAVVIVLLRADILIALAGN